MRDVIEEGFDWLFIQVFPIGAIAGFLQSVSIEDLLELMADRDWQVGLRQMQGFGDQRKA
jgi:hypothetical protein